MRTRGLGRIPDAAQWRLEATIADGERLLLDMTCLAAYLDGTEAGHPTARHVLDAFIAPNCNEAIVSMSR
jgi:hypothetical protein